MATREVPSLGPEDDCFHQVSDDWWESETAWFSFSVPRSVLTISPRAI
jgi:hypothetical protein